MLILNTDMWEKDSILKMHSSTSWNQADAGVMTQCALKQIKDCLQEVTDSGKKMILIVDLSKGDFPPWMQALSIAKFFMNVKSLLKTGMAFTIIYASTEEQQKWINRILTVYTPARPVEMVTNKKDIVVKITEYKKSPEHKGHNNTPVMVACN